MSITTTIALPALANRYQSVRAFTESLCSGLELEDYVVQSMDDVSPTKWHLAHTTWFFETFVLTPHLQGYETLNATYAFLFNSYYVQAGERHCRAQRGYLSRPTVREVFEYRAHVDAAMRRLLERELSSDVHALIELGINHEQQHQELMLMDIKHVFSVNPLRPVYRERPDAAAELAADVPPLPAGLHSPSLLECAGGVYEIGHDGRGFAYDNEGPRHRVFLEPFAMSRALVTNGEYLAFMNDGGYTRADLWLSLGWDAVQRNAWSEPFYWEQRDGEWWHFTLAGMQRVDPMQPVCHLSYFEADAFARWAGARLPTEAEWEVVAADEVVRGNFVERGLLQPARGAGAHDSLYGDVWQWTQSPYAPYPGFRAAAGAVGEYNGKFMCNQFVLRGGSCVTSQSHVRATYRNFFAPESTWQFSGLRLAHDLA